MAYLKINPDAELTPAERTKIQKFFDKVDVEVKKAKALEQSAKTYFSTLEKLNTLVCKGVDGFEDTIVKQDGDEVDIDYDHPIGNAADLFDFWCPSSMTC